MLALGLGFRVRVRVALVYISFCAARKRLRNAPIHLHFVLCSTKKVVLWDTFNRLITFVRMSTIRDCVRVCNQHRQVLHRVHVCVSMSRCFCTALHRSSMYSSAKECATDKHRLEAPVQRAHVDSSRVWRRHQQHELVTPVGQLSCPPLR